MDTPRVQRNRIHLDVAVARELAPPRLADAEGNEVCVCTWQGRD